MNTRLLLTAGFAAFAITGAAPAQGMMGGVPSQTPAITGGQVGQGTMGSGAMVGCRAMMGSGGMMPHYQPGTKPTRPA